VKLLRLVIQTVTTRSRARGGMGEGSWVHSRHPDASLVNLEKIGDQGIEVNIGVGKVIKGELFPVPVILGQHNQRPKGTTIVYIWNSASRISIGSRCSNTFCWQTLLAFASLASLSRRV